MAEFEIGGSTSSPHRQVAESQPAVRNEQPFNLNNREILFPAQFKTESDRARTELSNDAWRPTLEVKNGESIQRAIDRAPDGSVIHVQPGTYRERLVINRDNITLKGDGKAVLDLDGKNISGAAIQLSDRKNVTIAGFEIKNVRGGETPTGIRVDGASKNIALLNNNIHHVESDDNAHGIAVFGTKATPLSNVRIEGNRLHDLKLGQSETLVVNGNVDGFRIVGNRVHDNDNIGIDIIGGEGVSKGGLDRARNGLIANNQVYNIDSLKNPTYRSRSAAGIYVDGGSDITIRENDIFNSNYGIELASERRGWNTERIRVQNNRISGSHLAGITLGGGSPGNGGVSDSVVENNDLRGNAKPIWRQNNVKDDVYIRNNK